MCTFSFAVLLAVWGVSVASVQLRTTHFYPLDGNFSYVKLTCLDGTLPAQGVEFQLNATDIEEIIHDVWNDGNDTISFVFTQNQEGNFTCSRNGTVSSGIALAAQPTIEKYPSKTYSVYLPSENSEISTELQCDLKPGALVQRYSVQWKRVCQNENCNDLLPIADYEQFNITLNVTSRMNGSQYQCEVTINHNGSLSRTYYGGVITIQIEAENSSSKLKETYVISSLIFICVLLVALMPLVTTIRRCKKNNWKQSYYTDSNLPLKGKLADLECEKLINDDSYYQSSDFISSSNTTTNAVPMCVKPTATLKNCTSAGITYRDRLNGFKLEIPRGAIPAGESLTIDIGVTLYGPFQYPEGLRPVSPVFWICVRNRKHHKPFLKPLSITLQHFLNVESKEDVELLGLAFLKGEHEMNIQKKYEFQTTESKSIFKANTNYGTLHTYHLCYQCIASKINEITLQKAKFCLFGTVPRTFVYDKPMYIVFFVTFLLKTCLETVHRQIMNMPEIREYEYHPLKKEFQFSSSPTPALRIEIPKDLPGGWHLGLLPQNKITLEEIDFLQISQEELRLKEEEGMYPPHFWVVIDGTNTTQKIQAQILFTGTRRDESLVCDIPLDPSPQGSAVNAPRHSSMACATPVTSATPMTPVILKNLMNLVAAEIPNKWMEFGVQLDIPYEELDTYPSHKYTECFSKLFSTWKRSGSPPYTWETVISVLESPSLNERELGQKIRKLP